MIRRIGHEIAERIREKAWADRVAGIVVRHEYVDSKGKKLAVPVSCDVSGKDCTEAQLVQLLPDERRRSVIFIEDRSGARRIGDEGQWVKFQAILRIVGWINPKQMGLVADCEGCGTAYKISQEIFELLPSRNTNIEDCNIVGLNFDHYGYEKTGENPWKGYGLDDTRRPLLLPPFDFFAMDLVCQWRVHSSCLGKVVVGDPSGCGAPTPIQRRYPKDFECEELTDPTTGLTEEQLDCLGCGSGGGSGCEDCDPLSYSLANTDDTQLLSGLVNEPCGKTLALVAPDAAINLVDAKDNPIGTYAAPSGASTQVTAPSATYQLKDTGGTDIGSAGTIHSGASADITAPDAEYQLKDSAGTNIGSPGSIVSNGSANITAPDGTAVVKNLNGTTIVTSAVKSNETKNITAPIPLKFGWGAGNADTLVWTVTDDEAGTYNTYTPTGTNGTLTYSKNGGGYAALSGTIVLAVSDTITVRRTTTTNAGSVKWAP